VACWGCDKITDDGKPMPGYEVKKISRTQQQDGG